MRRPDPWSRELVVLRALAHLEESDPRPDGPAVGYGLHMLRQATNAWVGRGRLTRLCAWGLAEVVRRNFPSRPGSDRLIDAGWVLTWEGYVWLAEERLAREAAG